jgi:hypothetical protein
MFGKTEELLPFGGLGRCNAALSEGKLTHDHKTAEEIDDLLHSSAGMI